MKIIAHIEKQDNGTISIKKDAKVEYLEQGDIADSKSGLCRDILYSAFEKLNEMEIALTNYERKMSNTLDSNELNYVI